jgi:hypothetical protein
LIKSDAFTLGGLLTLLKALFPTSASDDVNCPIYARDGVNYPFAAPLVPIGELCLPCFAMAPDEPRQAVDNWVQQLAHME